MGPAPPAVRVACFVPATTAVVLGRGPLLLSGCAAGQAQTADQVAAIDGAKAEVGDIASLNARLAAPNQARGLRHGVRHRVAGLLL